MSQHLSGEAAPEASVESTPYGDTLFWIGFSLLLCHEMDAVLHAEWRVLPLMNRLPEVVAYPTFILMHVPLLVLLMLALSSRHRVLRLRTQIGVNAFLLLHAVLHTLFHGHAEYHFSGVLSHGLIYGGAAAGALHLFWLYRRARIA